MMRDHPSGTQRVVLYDKWYYEQICRNGGQYYWKSGLLTQVSLYYKNNNIPFDLIFDNFYVLYKVIRKNIAQVWLFENYVCDVPYKSTWINHSVTVFEVYNIKY